MASNSSKDPEKTADLPPHGSRNADPITDTPGSHPIETGVGAAAGGAASGMALGAVAGPPGMIAGAILGAVAGGYAGKGVGELVDPTTEDNWLREYHSTEGSSSVANSTHDTFRPAYRYGLESSQQHTGKRFEDVESHLRTGYESAHAGSGLGWDQARGAVRHAFDRANQSIQLREEQLRVSKTQQQTGEVGIRKEVHTEHKQITVPVEREEVVIERRPVTGHTAATGEIRAEEIHIPVKEEKVNVHKEAVVTEEVSIGKRKVQDTETVAADLRKEEVRVEQTGDVDVKGNVRKS